MENLTCKIHVQEIILDDNLHYNIVDTVGDNVRQINMSR